MCVCAVHVYIHVGTHMQAHMYVCALHTYVHMYTRVCSFPDQGQKSPHLALDSPSLTRHFSRLCSDSHTWSYLGHRGTWQEKGCIRGGPPAAHPPAQQLRSCTCRHSKTAKATNATNATNTTNTADPKSSTWSGRAGRWGGPEGTPRALGWASDLDAGIAP